MAWLALDQGTSATKALVIDDAGTILGLVEHPLNVRTGADGAVETDPEAMWQSVVDAGTAALRAAGEPTLEGVSFANQGETVLAWDPATGEALTPAIVWQDRRSRGVCDRLRPYAPEIAAITGLELDPYFVAPKLRWLRDELTRDGVMGTTDTWLLQRLCGAFVTDVATASRSLLLDLDRRQWSDACVDWFDLGDEELPLIVANDAVVGVTDAFGRATDVRGLCVDQQAALYAERCLTRGEIKCTYGTGAFVLANAGATPVRSTTGLVGCVAWETAAHGAAYCLDGQVYTAGAAVTWLQHVGIIDTPSDLDALGGAVGSSGGVAFVPGLAGLAAPFWAADARGAFTGLSLSTSREHLVRAALEGIAAQIAWLLRAVANDLAAPVTRLRVDGGLTRSSVLLQLQADLAQVPIDVYPSPHATAFGVAQFGGARVPEYRPERTIDPRIDASEADAHLEAWHRAVEATMTQ